MVFRTHVLDEIMMSIRFSLFTYFTLYEWMPIGPILQHLYSKALTKTNKNLKRATYGYSFIQLPKTHSYNKYVKLFILISLKRSFIHLVSQPHFILGPSLFIRIHLVLPLSIIMNSAQFFVCHIPLFFLQRPFQFVYSVCVSRITNCVPYREHRNKCSKWHGTYLLCTWIKVWHERASAAHVEVNKIDGF